MERQTLFEFILSKSKNIVVCCTLCAGNTKDHGLHQPGINRDSSAIMKITGCSGGEEKVIEASLAQSNNPFNGGERESRRTDSELIQTVSFMEEEGVNSK